MNRKKFTWLIVMMLFSITGIIWVQLIWIRNAVGIRNENFDNFVISSIRDAADAIESSRKMNFLNNFIFTPQMGVNSNQSSVSSYTSIGNYTFMNDGNISVRITNQSVTREPGKGNVVVVTDTSYSTGLAQFNTENSGVRYIRQQEFADWVKKKSDEFRNMSDRMISEVYQWEKTMELDNKEIDFAIRRSLQYVNIETPFEYAIIENGAVKEGTFKKTNKSDFLKSRYMVRLFPDNIIQRDMVLSVVFPERTNYVLGSMAWILGGSFLFSLIMMATFAMSIFFIIRQKKISEMKSDFINNMTHEFKTPIATISLAADTITNPKVISDEQRIRHFIGMIKKENSRMNKKVETILQIASLDKKEIEFRFDRISLHTVIEKAVESFDIIIQQRNGKVLLELNSTDDIIDGDADHLFNLFNNLIDNAVKYSEGSPEIKISTVSDERGIIVSVEDKGIGMSKQVQSRIFERFYRQTSGNVHDVKGFGLGLNYARAIVDAHHGDISVSSEPGKGSRFDVYLPMAIDKE